MLGMDSRFPSSEQKTPTALTFRRLLTPVQFVVRASANVKRVLDVVIRMSLVSPPQSLNPVS
jgi:hypothetical protein